LPRIYNIEWICLKIYFTTHFHLKTLDKYPWNLKKKQFIQSKKVKNTESNHKKISLNPDPFFEQGEGSKTPQ
jgi:hypothetical protein